ncbi:cobyrinate a,c-diamide synthase [Bacillus benzoevorans]|uniref:Cobyrinate a,c-diamide synthase n=1 Tax=Bacillus benzoevorans TaxID=1456 RepID=A0A7X0HQK3_9BACI|nr:cobyrinic acid a,c-diamide synthase [Bacillus benzoevorans]
MSNRRLVIAGTGSGVGKTTFTIGIMAALQQKGYTVQGFKCGPDYIDPTYHTAVTGRVSRNLDSWMFTHETVREITARAAIGADISIIEGVMGFFDGKSPLENTGSTAEISMITESPVILIVNCASMARSAAAIVKGFQTLASGPNIVGVIANRVGSKGHFEIVKAAIEQECHVPVIGFLKAEQGIDIPSRHLGLIPAIERRELDPFFAQLGRFISETVDIDRLYELAETPEIIMADSGLFGQQHEKSTAIAVARDAAFNFYYQENLELLEAYGAKLNYFSPLNNEEIPAGSDGLYIGGGFPEEFASVLARNEKAKNSIRAAVSGGMPTLAECGGFMYLTELIIDTNGEEYPMAGLIPGHVKMQKKLAALGYREIIGRKDNFLIGEGMQAKGHEFHYSTFESPEELPYAYETKGRAGFKEEGYLTESLTAGYTHFHFASNPQLAKRWIETCIGYRQKLVTRGER